MTEVSPAYKLTKHVHDTFFAPTDNLTAEEREESGIRADLSEAYQTTRLTALGIVEGKPVSQHLSLGKTGIYYLTTVFYEGGRLRLSRITPNASPEKTSDIFESLFMKALIRVAYARNKDLEGERE